MTRASFSTPLAARPLVRFLRTPKGLLLVIFAGLLAASFVKPDNLIVAAEDRRRVGRRGSDRPRVNYVPPPPLDTPGRRCPHRDHRSPSSCGPRRVGSSCLAPSQWRSASKHALRTHWSNIFNPAAFALVVAAIALNTGQDWWGALPSLGIAGALIVLATGVVIADRINKLPMILAFFGAYFALFTIASLFRSDTVAETFVTPDLQAALVLRVLHAGRPADQPRPLRGPGYLWRHRRDRCVLHLHAVRRRVFLPAGLLAGNVWESARRLVVGRMRDRGVTATEPRLRRSFQAGGIAAAIIVLPLVMASGIIATSSASVESAADSSVVTAPAPATSATAGTASAAPTAAPSVVQGTPNPYPFLPSFDADFNGNYTQTNDGTSARLVMDGLATGPFSVGVHVELLQVSVVPTPDDESIETTPDDEASEAKPTVSTTVNSAQLLDPTSKSLLCDGKLTTLSQGTMRFSCDGTAAYIGVQMQLGGRLDATPDGTLSGALSGTMQRAS